MTAPLQAAEPLVTISKPGLGDIRYSLDGRFLATLVYAYVEFLGAETLAPVTHIEANGIMYGGLTIEFRGKRK